MKYLSICDFFCQYLFYMATILQWNVPRRWFSKKLSFEPCMDVLSHTSMQVIDSTHYNIENIWKVHLCLTSVKAFSLHTHKLCSHKLFDSLVYQSHYMLYRYILQHYSCWCLLYSAPFLFPQHQYFLGSQVSLWSKWCLVLADLKHCRLIASCCLQEHLIHH